MGSTVSSTVSRVLGARRRLARAAGSNFYYSFLLLPRAERRAIKDVYAFCRLLDDVVDEDQTGRNPNAELEYWRGEVEAIYQGLPSSEFGEQLLISVEEFDLPKQPFLTDRRNGNGLKWHSYQTFAIFANTAIAPHPRSV
jgi:phytoene/squalene synthetase